MFALIGFYYIILLAVTAFLLYMIFRFVKAVEKFAEAYERKNSLG